MFFNMNTVMYRWLSSSVLMFFYIFWQKSLPVYTPPSKIVCTADITWHHTVIRHWLSCYDYRLGVLKARQRKGPFNFPLTLDFVFGSQMWFCRTLLCCLRMCGLRLYLSAHWCQPRPFEWLLFFKSGGVALCQAALLFVAL